MVDPVLQIIGMKAKACAALVSSVISPIIAFKTPTLPFSRPARDRLTTRAGKLRERPKQTVESARPNMPISKTGLRPILSDSLPHCRVKRVWPRKNVDSFPARSSGAGAKSQGERTNYNPSIVSSPIFISLCNSCIVYQSKHEREDDRGGDRFTELHKQKKNCCRYKIYTQSGHFRYLHSCIFGKGVHRVIGVWPICASTSSVGHCTSSSLGDMWAISCS
jgi:hypothetical protein